MIEIKNSLYLETFARRNKPEYKTRIIIELKEPQDLKQKLYAKM
jgi:hypothetical protein